MTTLTSLEAARAALASANTTITFTVSERDDAQHGAVIVVENTALEGLDDAAAFEVQERDDRTSAKALAAAGFEMVASGANGAPQGGCWSYWRDTADAAPTDAEAASGTQRFEATLDRDAREVSILCTETSDSIEDGDGVSQWPEAQPADLDAVRASIEAQLGVWIEALPHDGGWSATEGDEVAAGVALCDEQPTHRITFTPAGGEKQVTLVRLVDGAAYTHAEWETESTADWECSEKGEWRFQGQATPGGANGEVTVERI